MNKLIVLFLSAFALILTSCNDDDGTASNPFVVAFENLSANFLEITDEEIINLTYSEAARQNGTITIQISAENAVYGVDFETVPPAEANTISLPIASGENQSSFSFYKLNSDLDETSAVAVEFTITSIDHDNSLIQGNTNFLVSATASLGGSIAPEIGGPNQGDQVFVDLSSRSTTVVQRDTWDLGFYSGDEFRVVINGSIQMAAAVITPETTDIDAIMEDDVVNLQPLVAVGTFNPVSGTHVDAPNGDILQTAIAEISLTDEDNKVYLINLGNEVGTETPEPGSVAIAGPARGWKKIRILRDGEDYLLQYADLNDVSHQEIKISKQVDYNFTFFSFNTESIVAVEPIKEKWDISFTVFTNVLDGAGAYGFSDFVIHNRKGGVAAYQVFTENFTYENFSINDVDPSAFSEDQTTIGSNWRQLMMGESRMVYEDRFYIIKDANDNVYKLKFLGFINESGARGYPEFEYNLLQ